MSTSALAKRGRIGVAFVKRIRKKWSNGAFFTNERYTRSVQYHASPKGHIRKGEGAGWGEFVMRRSSRTQPHSTHTYTNTLALTFLHLAGQISLALFLPRAQPPHPPYICISIRTASPKSAFFRKIVFFPPLHTILDTFK